MADDIRHWSDELAREPSSLVFLQLSETLRRQGQYEMALKIALRGLERHPRNTDAHDLVARIAVDRRDFARAYDEWETVLKIAPSHVGAMKGLGYVCFQQGRFDDAERFLSRAAAGGGGSDVTNALHTVRRSSGGIAAPLLDGVDSGPSGQLTAAAPAANDPQSLFADILLDGDQTALLLDGSGYVLAGAYIDADGANVSQDVGAQLSGISDEVQRSTKHLDIGEWRSITFETHATVVAMAPSEGTNLMVVAASRATPLGLLRRLLERCGVRASAWLNGASA
jgi:tetratricopeptide (TPR) repeat protein